MTGLLRVVKQQVKIPVRVMIRPRAGDFHYSDQEMDVMRTDIRILKENGADGFVLGLLHRSVHLQFLHRSLSTAFIFNMSSFPDLAFSRFAPPFAKLTVTQYCFVIGLYHI